MADLKHEGLVYVRYRDHVLFRDADHGLYKPVVREAVGWLVKESSEAVWILWDRSVEKVPDERVQPRESGLIILKSDILELRRLVSQGICTSSRSISNVEYALRRAERKTRPVKRRK